MVGPIPSSATLRRLIGACLLLIACSPSAPPTPAAPGNVHAPATDAAPKTMNVVLIGEPRALTPWKESTTAGVFNIHEAITNGLIGSGANSEPIPRLAADVPSPDRGTWIVNADGSMETTYRLQPNAVWHDGMPVTAPDIAFSTKVQLDPRVEVNPIFAGTLRSYGADRVDTPDDRTAVIHWTKPFGFADFLTFRDFSPLPTHLLQPVYERDIEEFSRHPYWSDDSVFVGNGPYRLARWQQGVMMDLRAFNRYYLGTPKIE